MTRVSIIPNLNDPASHFVHALMESKYFPMEEQLILEGIYSTGLSSKFIAGGQPVKVYEATLSQWIEQKAAKAKEIIKSGTDKAKDKAVQFIAKYGEKFSTYIKMIVEQVNKLLKGAWNFIKGQVTSGLSGEKDKLIEHIKGAKYEDAKIKEEVSNMKDMGQAAMKFLGGGVAKQMEDGMMKAGADADVSESMLMCLSECAHDKDFVKSMLEYDPNRMYESDGVSVPGLSKLAHAISKYPPFSWLHSFEDLVKEKTNNTLSKISHYLHTATGAGGPYDFVIVGALLALVAGMGAKMITKDVIQAVGLTSVGMAIAVVIPGIGLLLTIMNYIAKGIWIVGIMETTIQAVGSDDHSAGEHDAAEH